VHKKKKRGEGKGLVTKEDIPKGKQIWKYRDQDHLRFKNKEELMKGLQEHIPDMDKEKVREFLSHVYMSQDPQKEWAAAYEIDDSHFFNHSLNPNCGSPVSITQGKKRFKIDIRKDPLGTYAYRSIKAGEELLINYDYDKVFAYPDWLIEIKKEYGSDYSTVGWV